jgi:hypothetical protein
MAIAAECGDSNLSCSISLYILTLLLKRLCYIYTVFATNILPYQVCLLSSVHLYVSSRPSHFPLRYFYTLPCSYWRIFTPFFPLPLSFLNSHSIRVFFLLVSSSLAFNFLYSPFLFISSELDRVLPIPRASKNYWFSRHTERHRHTLLSSRESAPSSLMNLSKNEN